MLKKITLLVISFFSIFHFSKGQSINDLRQKISAVLVEKSATVGVAIQGINPSDTISFNGNSKLPTQSVYKLHLAIAVLDQVDKGRFSLNDSIKISKKLIETYSHLWSPLKKKYPDGANVTIAELIKYTVSWSDNLGCDVLFDLIGGPKFVNSYLHRIGINDISVVYKELFMQSNWDLQYNNWMTAKSGNQLLKLLYENKNLLSEDSYQFIITVLKETKTGKNSIRGLLAEDVVIAHKTGHSGKNEEGLTAALNDIGIIFLPDGSYYYLSVLVSDSKEDSKTNQRIIAEISKLTWDYFNSKN